MNIDGRGATFFGPSDVVTEYRWSFPHHLTLALRVCETGETVLAIVQDNGLLVDEHTRAPSLSGIQAEASPDIAAVIQDHIPTVDLSSRHVSEGPLSEEGEARSVPTFGTRIRSAVSAACRELWKRIIERANVGGPGRHSRAAHGVRAAGAGGAAPRARVRGADGPPAGTERSLADAARDPAW
jgi:hypothetical protein